jgi:hypothetical protein
MWNCLAAVCSIVCNVRNCIHTISIWECCALAFCFTKVKACFTSTGHKITDCCKSTGNALTDCCDSITHHNDPNTADHIELTGSVQHHGPDAV